MSTSSATGRTYTWRALYEQRVGLLLQTWADYGELAMHPPKANPSDESRTHEHIEACGTRIAQLEESADFEAKYWIVNGLIADLQLECSIHREMRKWTESRMCSRERDDAEPHPDEQDGWVLVEARKDQLDTSSTCAIQQEHPVQLEGTHSPVPERPFNSPLSIAPAIMDAPPELHDETIIRANIPYLNPMPFTYVPPSTEEHSRFKTGIHSMMKGIHHRIAGNMTRKAVLKAVSPMDGDSQSGSGATRTIAGPLQEKPQQRSPLTFPGQLVSSRPVCTQNPASELPQRGKCKENSGPEFPGWHQAASGQSFRRPSPSYTSTAYGQFKAGRSFSDTSLKTQLGPSRDTSLNSLSSAAMSEFEICVAGKESLQAARASLIHPEPRDA